MARGVLLFGRAQTGGTATKELAAPASMDITQLKDASLMKAPAEPGRSGKNLDAETTAEAYTRP